MNDINHYGTFRQGKKKRGLYIPNSFKYNSFCLETNWQENTIQILKINSNLRVIIGGAPLGLLLQMRYRGVVSHAQGWHRIVNIIKAMEVKRCGIVDRLEKKKNPILTV